MHLFFNIFKNGCKFVKSCKIDIKGLLFVELSRSGAYFSHIYALFIDFCHTRRLQDFGKVSKKIYNLKVQNEDRKGFLKKSGVGSQRHPKVLPPPVLSCHDMLLGPCVG